MRKLAVVVLGLLPLSSAYAGTIKIWVKSFIPKEHPSVPGYMRSVPGQPGKVMIPSPSNSETLGNLGVVQVCFGTDNRGFSSDVNVSARITTDVTLTVNGGKASMKPSQQRGPHFAGLTHKINCATGEDLQSPRAASTEDCGVGEPAIAQNIVTVTLGCKAKDPFYNVPGAPALDYNGTFKYDIQRGTMRFTGDVGIFPAFESYVSVDGRPAVKMFAFAPKEGAGAFSLYDLGLALHTRRVDTGEVDVGKFSASGARPSAPVIKRAQ